MSSTYFDEELRVQQAVDAFKSGSFSSKAAACRHFNAHYDRVKLRLRGHQSRITRQPANTLLTPDEENGLLLWFKRSDEIRQRVTREMLEYECNFMLAQREYEENEPPTICGNHWATRFLQRHPSFKLVEETTQELDRQAAEDPVVLGAWFEEFAQVVAQNDIEVEDIYNYDETGIRLGVGKKKWVITKASSSSSTVKIRAGTTTSRESSTICETISADGHFLPPLVILKGKTIQQRWCTESPLPGSYLLAANDTAWMNDELLLKWAEHFNKYSALRQKGKYRLLLLDNHGSHCTRQFIQYCDNNGIWLFSTIPHTTHLVQPLDVVIFQPYKHWYGKAVAEAYATGCLDFDKMELLNSLHTIRVQTFKKSSILSAWKKAGLIPYAPEAVLDLIQLPIPETPPPNASTSYNIEETPETVGGLTALADWLYNEEDSQIPWSPMQDRFIRASLSIAHAASIQQRQLIRVSAAEKRRQQQKNDARKSLQTGGTMYVQEGRNAVLQKEDDALNKAKEKFERLQKRKDNKVKKAAKAAEIQARKDARLARKTVK
jgi:hypothetical protein